MAKETYVPKPPRDSSAPFMRFSASFWNSSIGTPPFSIISLIARIVKLIHRVGVCTGFRGVDAYTGGEYSVANQNGLSDGTLWRGEYPKFHILITISETR